MNDSSTAQAGSLSFPESFAQWLGVRAGQPVQMLQTHVSWVFLVGDDAYKLKKPVKFPFLDFSTPALRKHFCEEEVKLNSRLAPDLYLGVLPIFGAAHAPTLDAQDAGSDAVLDYAVHMKRFEAGALLAEQLPQGRVDMADMRALAVRLGLFHQALPVATPDARYGSADMVIDEVQKVLVQLVPTAFAARAQQWQAWVDAKAAALREVFVQRHTAGLIRECHGDLHLSNVVKINGQITAFDGIDFQPAMRWIDLVNDVAFLTMDLQVQGRADLAAGFMDDYLQATGDYAGVQVWRFYEVYRALVRAMVAQLSTGGQDASAGAAYAEWLDAITAPDAAVKKPLRLTIMHGVSGSGKSTVSRALVEREAAVRIRSDVERKRLFGLAPMENSHEAGLDIYTAEASRRVFNQLHADAQLILSAGYSVVVDAAFLRHAERQRYLLLAQQLEVDFAIIDCKAPQEQLHLRIAERLQQGQDPSEATADVVANQLAADEPFVAAELPFVRAAQDFGLAPADQS